MQEHTHAAIAKAWRILGFNPANLRVLQADPAHRLQPRRDRRRASRIDRAGRPASRSRSSAPRARRTPARVDPLNDLADLAAARGPVVPRRRRLRRARPADAAGRDLARRASSAPTRSSWTRTSGSSSPYEIGAVLVRRPAGARAARSRSTAPTCATRSGGEVEFRDRGPQLTRGSRALKLYLSLQVFGLDAFKAAIARGIALAEHARDAAASATRRGRSSRPPRSAIVCFRRAGHDDEQTDALVRARGRGRLRRAEHDDPRRPHRRAAVHDQPAHHRARHRGHDRAARAARGLRGPGGPAHRRPPLLQVPLVQPGLVWSGQSGRSAGVALRGVREGCRPLGHAHRKPARRRCARSLDRTQCNRFTPDRPHVRVDTRATWRVDAHRVRMSRL